MRVQATDRGLTAATLATTFHQDHNVPSSSLPFSPFSRFGQSAVRPLWLMRSSCGRRERTHGQEGKAGQIVLLESSAAEIADKLLGQPTRWSFGVEMFKVPEVVLIARHIARAGLGPINTQRFDLPLVGPVRADEAGRNIADGARRLSYEGADPVAIIRE